MALEQHAFLARENVPAVMAWQAAITQLGFALQVDPALEPFEASGFVPCKLGQVDTGFEIYYESADELFRMYPHIKDNVSPRNAAISFRW